MGTAKKIFIFSSFFLLFFAGLIAAAAAYFYAHPEIVAARAGKYLSDAAGLDFQADRLNWSLRPLSIEAGSVSVSKPKELRSISRN